MKISLGNQAIKKEIHPSCTVIEHSLNHEMLDIAISTIAGRYPSEKRVVNQQCAELAYVFEGAGKIVIDDQEHHLKTGDAVVIEAGEKYYWEGNMKLFLSCRPAWHKNQHQMTD